MNPFMKSFLSLLVISLTTTSLFAADVPVALSDFHLVGQLKGDHADFTLTATATVEPSHGAAIPILSGPIALTSSYDHASRVTDHSPRLTFSSNQFFLSFDHRGQFPIRLEFSAAVTQTDNWRAVAFHLAPAVLQPVTLRGLSADTEIFFAGAARPERKDDDFQSYLPSDGAVNFSWKQVRPETEGKLFFSAEMLAQITVRPGLMRQTAILNFKVMQGELNRVALALRGDGDVTRIQGDHVLSWRIEPGASPRERRLLIELNAPQKDQFSIQAQIETPLGAFPQTADAFDIRPEDATHFDGYIRVVNEGAVRLEVSPAAGMSQIAPEQFPETDATRAALRAEGNQRFAYRFAGADFALRIAADQISPEVSASHLLTYHDGENELSIEDEIELDIHEAPLRELALRVPKGYAIASLNAADLADYFLTEPPGESSAELRLVYGKPVSGRQLVQLRLESNHGLADTNWTLPRIDVLKAKSSRGTVGVSADAGFRLTPEKTQALTEIAAAFFPGKAAGLQTAFRINDAAWSASLRVERLPQSVQVDALHLFSIGEGVAYGSSILTYTISGAPTPAFKVELSDEYSNVEFTGKDIRAWQKIPGGYLVQLHSPVAGAYSLLATYERPFKPQGETLAFTGARPLDASSEQGYTLVISAYQFQVKPTDVSSTLLPLEPAEVPSEYRLFLDAPILAAYRYAARPFDLKLSLSPLAQGESVNQIVDRASLQTRVSKEGQIVTTARYFIKNRGEPGLRLTLPPGSDLWSASINGAPVVPVLDGAARLIPLPHTADPNAIQELDLTLASRNADSEDLEVRAPIVGAPIMLGEWKLKPDTGQRLVFRGGSLLPVSGPSDVSGFAQLARLFSGANTVRAWVWLIGALLLSGAATFAIRRPGYHIGSSLIALAGGTFCVVQLALLAGAETAAPPGEITFLAPVQQAGSALSVSLSNLSIESPVLTRWAPAWPALLAIPLWLLAFASRGNALRRSMFLIAGWLAMAIASLNSTNGAQPLIWILGAFLLSSFPGWRQIWFLTHSVSHGPTGAAPATTALIVAALFVAGSARAMPDSVSQSVRVQDKFVSASAKIHWQAAKGDTLPLLAQPAVLTHVSYPTHALRLTADRKLVALARGVFDIEVDYETPVASRDADAGFASPVPCGLMNRVDLTIVGLDVDVLSPQAVSTSCDHVGTNTVASMSLTPSDAWIAWRPRSRDIKREKAVFYAELSQLFVPLAGVVEGAHVVSIRPAQGELSEIVLTIPTAAAVSDVTGPAVRLWRFDPDSRKLRVTLDPAQSHPFTIVVRTQTPGGPLPFEQKLGLVAVDNAAGQIGQAAIATGNEVQLDAASGERLSPINLEDFPADAASALASQTPGLTVRRAFRYSDPAALLSLKASPVEPDVRVECQSTLSLGEDRSILAARLSIDITRAGIFDLSFALPAGFDVESISGAALSQWTQSKSDSAQIVTLHLTGKTVGNQIFDVSLAGPGVKAARDWPVPQIAVREAAKQQGSLLIVPEQGMRLLAVRRDGYTQLDPQKSGVREKGALSFHQLQTPSALTLDIEQVDPWVQVTSLQHAAVTEAQLKITANLQFQIENTGLKSFRIRLPTNAEGARFEGDQLADFQPEDAPATNGLQPWSVKLRRRVIGPYLLQVFYQIPLANGATDATLRGVQAAGVNLQRGFVTLQSDPRLQVAISEPPQSLQPTEWQSIPRTLQKDLQTAAANYTFRLVDPAFQLPLKLERRQAAKVLPAHVINIALHTVISDDGVALTQARLEIVPGDKRLLAVSLPKDARFWFAFLNDNGVWPWRDGTNILIPLERLSSPRQAATVEIYYSCAAGSPKTRALDLALLAPKFELPLEDISWRVSMSDKWRVKHWKGSLQFDREETSPQTAAIDPQAYLQTENNLQVERTKEAQNLLSMANSSLSNGDPQQARRAFEAAYGLSSHDAAFNEDARVQLHNIKVQQALVGINFLNSGALGDAGELGARMRELRTRKGLNYTQQDAKDIFDNNSADDNAAYSRVADKLIQQQDAAVLTPAVIRASIPEQGRSLTFKRAIAVDPWADLHIDLAASMPAGSTTATRLLILAAALAILALFIPPLRPPGVTS